MKLFRIILSFCGQVTVHHNAWSGQPFREFEAHELSDFIIDFKMSNLVKARGLRKFTFKGFDLSKYPDFIGLVDHRPHTVWVKRRKKR